MSHDGYDWVNEVPGKTTQEARTDGHATEGVLKRIKKLMAEVHEADPYWHGLNDALEIIQEETQCSKR